MYEEKNVYSVYGLMLAISAILSILFIFALNFLSLIF